MNMTDAATLQSRCLQQEEQGWQNPFVSFIFLYMEDTLVRIQTDPVSWASASQMLYPSFDSRQLLRLSTAYKEETLIIESQNS